MNKLHLLLPILIVAFTAQVVMADPVDNGPPAQQRKNVVPNSTSNGNYLEDEAGVTPSADTTQSLDKKTKKPQKISSKPNSKEKGKSHNETPENGGVDVQ